MSILVIDGQGGGMGKALIEQLRKVMPDVFIIAAGTNSIATSNMLRAGASIGATGENAIIYNCSRVKCILGPIGIVLAQSMYGELTPAIAVAVGSSDAQKLLIPVKRACSKVVGVTEKQLPQYIEEAVECAREIIQG